MAQTKKKRELTGFELAPETPVKQPEPTGQLSQAAMQSVQAVKPKPVSMPDPSKITQSYYQNPTTADNYTTGRPIYKPSQAVQDAANTYQQQQANKPGEYQSQYNDQIQGMIDGLLNREKFSYDFSQDPMYQMYAQNYQRNGQLAMRDAMAQSAQHTGGYGNSYAQQVGQQTYQRYLEDMDAKIIPQLRDAAYRMYQDDGDAMRGNLGMLQGQEQIDYGRYRDKLGDWQGDLDRYYNMYNDMSQNEYNRYLNDRGAWEADRDFWNQKHLADLDQARWEAEFYQKYGGGGRRGGGGGGGRGGRRGKGESPYFSPGIGGVVSAAGAMGGGSAPTLSDLVAVGSPVVNPAAVKQAADNIRQHQADRLKPKNPLPYGRFKNPFKR